MRDGKVILLLLALFGFILYVLRNLLGKISSILFVPLDKLLFISPSMSPVIMWMLFGLLVGLVYGSFIAIRKFKLQFNLLTFPIALLTIAMGLILLIAYFTKKYHSDADETVPDTTEVPRKPAGKMSPKTLEEFSNLLNKGMEAVKDEEYLEAETFFKKAASIGHDHPQLDSLASVYALVAKEKCELFSRDSQLKYIPNHYYKYAAILTKETPKVCE